MNLQGPSSSSNRSVAEVNKSRSGFVSLRMDRAKLPFKAEHGRSQYLMAGTVQRQAFLKNCARVKTSVWSQNESFGREHIKFLKKCNSEGLDEYFRISIIDRELSGIANRFRAQMTFLNRGEDRMTELIEENSREEIRITDIDRFLNIYEAPDRRILITGNLTFNQNEKIPVYSDVPGETLNNLQIPKSLTFEYVDANIINATNEKELISAFKMGNGEENVIKCNCRASGISNCYENPNCNCYQLNRRMKEFQIEKEGQQSARFNSFDRCLFNHVRDNFWRNVGFACSEACGCSGNCTNNPLFMINWKMFPLEVYRDSPETGFNIRSPVLIPAGTFVMEYIGEMKSGKNMKRTDEEHPFQVFYKCDGHMNDLIRSMPFSPQYKQLLLKVASNNVYIDPTEVGNVARMIGHSCVPNLEIIRVYQRSLSPAHIRFLFVTLADIFPGIPMRIDYGLNYMKSLVNGCKCGTFACRNNEHTTQYSQFSTLNLALAIRDIEDRKKQIYMEKVIDPIRIKK